MIDIAFPLGESQRAQAGLILFEAFRRKLQPLTGDPARTIPLLGAALNLDMVMGAVVDGRLLGVAGLHSHHGLKVVKTERYPLPRNWLGFSGDYVMVKEL